MMIYQSFINRAWNLKGSLAAWNLFLSIVSAIGAFRVGLHLLYLLSPQGGYTFRDTMCRYSIAL